MESNSAKRALDYGAKVLAPRMLSEKAVRDKLGERDFEDEDIEYAISRLTELGAINDEEYAAAICRHYTGRGFGEQKIAQELYRRGISREISNDVLEEFEPSGDKMIAYLEKTIKDNYDDRSVVRKATAGLARRGFSWDQITAAIDIYCNTEDDN